MNISDIRKFYGYNEWANDRIFKAVGSLPEDQYRAQLVSSFTSVAATLAHIVGSEWIWLQRFKGISPTDAPDWSKVAPGVRSLREQLNEVEQERARLVAAMDDNSLEEELWYKNLSGESKRGRKSDLLVHVTNHSTYHRGQLTTLLRQLGIAPPSTDMTLYNNEIGTLTRV